MKYDKLYKVLKLWYKDDQINHIWKMLINYDKQLNKRNRVKK